MTGNQTKKLTRVINIKRYKIVDRGNYVYIGRPGKWGNPFKIEKGVRTREQSIEEFREYINAPAQAELKARIILELKGKVLGCYCKPYDCHGDVLAAIANGEKG